MESNSFGEDIEWFVKNIGSRKSMLPTFAHASHSLFSNVDKELDKFIEDHGYDKEFDEEGDVARYAVPEEYYGRYSLLSRTHQHSLIFTDLLPKMTIVSLVSLFDAYLGKLVRTLFKVKPAILNGSSKQLTFAQMSELGSLEDAREHIINMEVESLLRDSHPDQFAWLEEKIGIPLRKNLPIWACFVELTERRNLFVHADGIVNKQYITACENIGYPLDKDVQIGSRLSADPEYYEKACDCIAEIGVKLGQVMWRKLSPESLEQADASIINVTYDFLFYKEYQLALVIAEFSNIPAFKNYSLENTYYLKVNHAIALKGLEKEDECEKLLSSIDWSALSDKFKISACVLREKWDEASELMYKIGSDGDIKNNSYRIWPLFRWFRKTDEFKSAYREIFGEEFKLMGNISPDDDKSDDGEDETKA